MDEDEKQRDQAMQNRKPVSCRRPQRSPAWLRTVQAVAASACGSAISSAPCVDFLSPAAWRGENREGLDLIAGGLRRDGERVF
jgi:hypothetical protein